jgi:MOSC domain-containing protein YiiM
VTGRVVSVQVGHVRQARTQGERAGRRGSTAIDKRPVGHRVAVGPLGLAGDAQADHRHHGGPDKAVYAYAREDAAFWSRELAREVPAGAFGENLAVEELDLTGAVIGERWAIGSALLEVRGPRTPCWKLAGFWQVPDLVKRFTSAARPGAYLGVLEPGDVGAGDEIRVVHRPAHGVTVGEVFRARTLERHLVPRLLDVPELPEHIRGWLADALAHREDAR